MHNLPIAKDMKDDQKRKAIIEAERRKLVNVIYHNDRYYVQEPWADRKFSRAPEVVIDRHLWLILKYLPKQRLELNINDVIRFGRVSFKVTELVVTRTQISDAALAID